MDRNSGKPWSETDLNDLLNAVRRGESIEAIASFLMRSEEEVAEKIRALASV